MIDAALDNLELLDQIHRDALRVLEEVGVRCDVAEVKSIFEETGLAAFDETTGHLHVMSALITQTLETAPTRDQYWIPEHSFGIGGTAPFVFEDMSGELIQPTIEHLRQIARIANEADPVGFMARGVLLPDQEVLVLDTMAALCDKPLYAAVVTEAGIARAEELVKSRGRLTIQFSLINSPLNVIASMIPPFLECVRKNLPVYVSTMPMAGLSAPYSMSGLLTLTHAEALFSIALAQLVNPGIPVIHAGLPSIANIQKNYAVDLGLTSHNLANLLMEKVNRRLNLPSLQSACTTSAEKPGPEAEADAIMGYALLKKYGFHHMRHAFGMLKELVSFSIAKLMRHIDLCSETTPARAPEVVIDSYDPEGLAAIARNGSQPNYMRDDHTLKNIDRYFII